jgi:hypothetical protein
MPTRPDNTPSPRPHHADPTSPDVGAKNHEDAVAAMAGLTLWRSAEARGPRKAVSRWFGIVAKLPPIARP